MTSDLRIDISRARALAVGSAHGVTPAELKGIAPRIAEAHHMLRQERAQGRVGFWDLYKDEAALKDVQQTAADLLTMRYDNLVILGIGGSALGTRALVTALKPPYYNLMSRRGRNGFPRIFVMDNIDPVTFRHMMRSCPPQKTLYNVISKSGGTAETMAQLLIVVEALEKKVGDAAMKDHLITTTNRRTADAPPNILHAVADQYGLKAFAIPLNVGGRFSIFSPVGMFPAAMLGMDIDAMMAGCAAMDKRCSSPELDANPAYLRAAVQYLADTRKGKTISVMMPYADGLADVAGWYCQLWAESLGKRFNLAGEEVYLGQTPVKAVGVTDQHSQLQLYREGPNDKIINTLEVKRFAHSARIPHALTELENPAYLRGKTLNKLMAAELQGTLDALKLSRRPVSRIILSAVNAHTLAQLLYMFEVETAMAGRLYGVNAFDQPGVEEGKKIALVLMGGRA
jgi:glucose-6-phosphate isomerase